MANDCIFCRIISKEVPGNIFYENESLIVLDDLHPKARYHKLIIPKIHIATFNDMTERHDALWLEMKRTALWLAKELQVASSGYQLRLHCGKGGGQEVFHLHWHFLAN